MNEPCPEDACWFWIPPGGMADMSGLTYKNIETALQKIEWTKFPFGGCSCTFGKCKRIHEDGTIDFFEPL